jgi:hypothetical protein
MRLSRLLGLLLAALLGATLLSAPAASAADPRKDHTRLPRSCATPAEEVPSDALICYLTPFQKNRPTVFFWGDSHVWMQIPGVLKAAKGRNVNVVTSLMGSCPPMDPGLSWKDRYRYGRCGASNVLATRFMQKMANGTQDFKLVLAGNWEMYERALKLIAQGKQPGKGHGEYAFYQAGVFKHGGPRLFKKLGQLGVDVDVIHQVARPPRKPKPCAKGMDPYQCNFPRRKAFQDEATTKQWLTRLTAPARVTDYVDVNDAICSASTCRGKIDGVWTYHDNSHITASMARKLSAYYAPSVADVVPGWTPLAPGEDGGDGGPVDPVDPVDPPCTIPLFC